MTAPLCRAQTDARFAALLPALHRRARRLTSCPHEAADLAQEAALKVWQKHCAGAKFDDLQSYAMTTLRNLARSRWRSRTPMDELQEDTATTPPDALRRLACDELRAALARLPQPQADLMALVEQGETSPAELACITGQPIGTVMSRLSRARSALRADLGLERASPSSDLLDHAQF